MLVERRVEKVLTDLTSGSVPSFQIISTSFDPEIQYPAGSLTQLKPSEVSLNPITTPMSDSAKEKTGKTQIIIAMTVRILKSLLGGSGARDG